MTAANRWNRVVIVDDHEMVRSGLATFLRVTDDLELVGEAESGEEAVAVCVGQPDVVLWIWSCPAGTGWRPGAVRALPLGGRHRPDQLRRSLVGGAGGGRHATC